MNKKSYHAKESEIKKQWRVIDLKGKILGRVATQIADILRGKDKPTFTPSADTGDFVIALNADHIKLTGRKLDKKIYYHHTGYFGGVKSITAKDQLKKNSTDIIYDAVWGMLPKGPLGRKQIKKLKVYTGTEHPHAAQMPTEKT